MKQKETEREEQRVLEEAEKEREKEQKRLANKEIGRFRDRVSYITCMWCYFLVAKVV